MLAYILAIAVGLGSFALYMSAFFFPEVHRKNDFVWSGVGLFYALILWACAGRFTGAVLLGQVASVSLLGWLGWQTLSLRRELTPVGQQTPIPADLKTQVNGFFRRPVAKVAPKPASKVVPTSEVATQNNNNIVLPESTVEIVSPSLTESIDNNIAPETQFAPPIPDQVEVNETEETVTSLPLELGKAEVSETAEMATSLPREVEETIETVEEIAPNAATLETTEPTLVPPFDSTVAEPPTPRQPNVPEMSIPVPPVTASSPTPVQPQKPAFAGGRLSGLLGTLTGLFQKKPKNKAAKPSKPEPTSPAVSVEPTQPSPIRDQTPIVETVTPIDEEFDEFDELESVVVQSEQTEDAVAAVESVEMEPEVSPEPIIAEVIETVEVTVDNVEVEPAEQLARSPFEQMVSPISTVEVVIEMTDEQLNQIADAVEEKLTENLSTITAEIVEVIEDIQDSKVEAQSSSSETTIPPSLVRPNPPEPDLKAAAQLGTESPSQPESTTDS